MWPFVHGIPKGAAAFVSNSMHHILEAFLTAAGRLILQASGRPTSCSALGLALCLLALCCTCSPGGGTTGGTSHGNATHELPDASAPPVVSALPASTLAVNLGGAPPEPHVIELARKAASIQQRLREQEVFVMRDESHDQLVPEATRSTLREFKDAALAVVEASLPALAARPPSDGALRAPLVAGGVDWADSEQWEEKAIVGIIEPAPGHRDRWVVSLCILLAPGSDCVLAVYERRKDQFQLALVIRSDDYESIQGAHHGSSWAISPPDVSDHYYIVVAHTFPWVAGSWRKFIYEAFEPTADPRRPKRLAQGTATAFWQAGFELEARQGGFSVSFGSSFAWDPKHFLHWTVHEWKRASGRFQRVGVRTLIR